MPPRQKDFSLEAEIQQARKEARPYRIDKSKLTAAERQTLRLRSRSIPLVADSEPLDVIYEDDVYLVVNKPSFLKMHPSHRFEGGSLLNRAIGHCGFAPKVMHRLDMVRSNSICLQKRCVHFLLTNLVVWLSTQLEWYVDRLDVSGSTIAILQTNRFYVQVVLGKTKEICEPIMKQFMAGRVKKQYLCIVDGVTDVQVGLSFTVDAPIEKSGVSFLRQVGDSREDSKPAQTVYTVLDKSSTVPMVLLHAAPLTGRTHQIRLHAKEALLPIVGDDLYNPKE